MRYLNKDEEQRFNEVLQRFSNSEFAEKIDVIPHLSLWQRYNQGKRLKPRRCLW